MNRFRLTSLLALVAAIALIASGCGDDKNASSSSVPPDQRVKTALGNASEINSGSVTIDASLSGAGLPGKMKLTGGGDFDTKAEGGPALDMTVKLDLGFGGEPQEIGLVSVGGKSYLKFGGKYYSADNMMEGLPGATGSTSTTKTAIDSKELQKLIDSLDGYVSDVKAAGTEKVGDEQLDVYTATIDVAKVLDEAKKQAGSAIEGLSALGGAGDLDKSVGETTVEIGIDANDLPRSFKLKTSMDGATGSTSSSGGSLEASLVLTEVNQPVTIEKPAEVEEGAGLLEALGSMFGGLGASGLGATGLGQ